MSEYTPRAWQNGESCPAHKVPYCTPCFNALLAVHENMSKKYPALARNFFFADSRRTHVQFAASCVLGIENFLMVPVEFAIVGDSKTAYKADEAETRAILTREHLWDISTPEWMQHTIPQLDAEDAVLLREFQLFIS
jgi:hypothetical protein